MKILKLSCVWLFAGVLAVGSRFLNAETMAVVIKVQGSVSVTRGDENSSSEVRRGHRLGEGDKIVTGSKSFIAFRFIDDASLVRIGANSTCTIQGRKDRTQIHKNIVMEAGTILTRITEQKGQFQVATPTSVASVKGTQWITDHQDFQGTNYFGEDGTVEITNDAGSVLMMAGQTVHVASKDAIPVVSQTQDGDKPVLDGDIEPEDELEFEFENDAGQKKTLKFKVIKE